MALQKCVDGVIIDMTAEEEAEFLASLPALIDPGYALSKLTITDRMSDDQLAQFDALLDQQSLRLRRAWADCQEVNSKHMFFAVLHWSMTEQWGTEEADRILTAP